MKLRRKKSGTVVWAPCISTIVAYDSIISLVGAGELIRVVDQAVPEHPPIDQFPNIFIKNMHIHEP